ncbi:hypothetical protein FACS189483_00620 [Spirochaetia bacterium]|nr:hypothetical protein FACS189483_00620 [Spirochaetia bacterium]
MKYFLAILCLFIIGCNSLPEYRFVKEYSQLNYSFSEIYKINTNEYGESEYPSGMRL